MRLSRSLFSKIPDIKIAPIADPTLYYNNTNKIMKTRDIQQNWTKDLDKRITRVLTEQKQLMEKTKLQQQELADLTKEKKDILEELKSKRNHFKI